MTDVTASDQTARADVLLLAAGRGERLGPQGAKALVRVGGKALFLHSLSRFHSEPWIERIVVVCPPDKAERERMVELARQEGPDGLSLATKIAAWIPGGATRRESALLGLGELSRLRIRHDRIVLIHDAARPFVSSELLDRCRAAMSTPLHGHQQERIPRVGEDAPWGRGPAGAIPGLPVRETLKLAVDGRVVLTQPREGLHAVQTPQAFRFGPLWAAHRDADEHRDEVTDDAQILERLGMPVRLFEGDVANLKVTYPEDVALAEIVLAARPNSGDPRPE